MKTYDPSKVTVTFAGITITGYMKGTFVKVTRGVEKWSHEAGAQGDVVRTKSLDDTAMVEITLQHTSPSNGDLTAQYLKDIKDGSGKGAISVEDVNSARALWAGAEAWIVTAPDFERADSLTPCVWKIAIAKLTDSYNDGARN